jgi:hypothetical protein
VVSRINRQSLLSLFRYMNEVNNEPGEQNREEWDGLGMWYVRGGRAVHKGVWRGNLKERDHL